MRIRLFAVTLLLLIASAARAADAPASAKSVLACMRANLPDALRVEQVELASSDNGVVIRTLQGKLYAQRHNGLLRSMLHLSGPPQLAGASYLFLERSDGKEIYLYLPALNRVRRITGAAAGGALFGTDISYSEISQIQNAFSGGAAKLEAPAKLQGRPVNVLVLGADPKQPSGYQKVRVWVDVASCVALKVAAYSDGKIVKEMTAPAKSLKQVDHHWLATQVTMRDLNRGTQTVVHITGVSSGSKIPSGVFDPHSFYLGTGS